MRVLLSLGSNLGDREKNLRAAIESLRGCAGIRVLAESRWYETTPVGRTNQPLFLNAAVEVETDLPPPDLLAIVKDIEKRLGRQPAQRWAERLIDIDIILCENLVMSTDLLTVPHKEFRRRAFVLTPLAEIAPDAIDPVTGLSVRELAARPDAEGAVSLYTPRNH